MTVSGGIRFLPIYGKSGSGKSCAARELDTHLPQAEVVVLSRSAVIEKEALLAEIDKVWSRRRRPELIIAVIDQYEEEVLDPGAASAIPTQFVDRISLLDRDKLREIPVLFVWLTTSKKFQSDLAAATSRNERILVGARFELRGPEPEEWTEIVEETFAFHNDNRPLADFAVLRENIEAAAESSTTLGGTILKVGDLIAERSTLLQDLSQHHVVMLWPVADGLRITRVSGFTSARDGYKLDWSAFNNALNDEDRRVPLDALNRARLYFDVRLVPIRAADLQEICGNLDDRDFKPPQSYLDRFERSHFASIVRGTWDSANFSPLRERDESERARKAREWYDNITAQPVSLGRRIASCLAYLGLDARYEHTLKTKYSTLRADIAVSRPNSPQGTCIVELKAFSTENTRPSSIKDAIRGTLRKHAQFAGFLPRQ